MPDNRQTRKQQMAALAGLTMINSETYPADTGCATCGQIWMAHKGELCPICLICNQPAMVHPTEGPNASPVIVEFTLRDHKTVQRWGFCSGGTAQFLPILDTGFDISDIRGALLPTVTEKWKKKR